MRLCLNKIQQQKQIPKQTGQEEKDFKFGSQNLSVYFKSWVPYYSSYLIWE